MSKINTIVCKYSNFIGTKTVEYIKLAIADDKVITNITAAPIPAEVSTLLETPRKGQSPRKRLNTTLFTKDAPIKINIFYSPFPYSPAP